LKGKKIFYAYVHVEGGHIADGETIAGMDVGQTHRPAHNASIKKQN
jgi:hypothetical protein